MTDHPRDDLRRLLLDRAFKPGEGVDQLGRPLAWSLDCRELTLHGPTLGMIAELLWPLVVAHQPHLIVGPSLSADPIVAALLLAASRRGIELSGGLLRREAKTYGLRKLVEGPLVVPGANVVVVDDVFTRGSSTARTIRALRELGAPPVAVVTIVDLERDDRELLEGIEYVALFTATELGLAPFSESPPSPTRGWALRGINSPILAAAPLPPLVTGELAILADHKRDALAVDRRGGVRTVDTSGALCAAAAADGFIVLGSAETLSAHDSYSLRLRWSIGIDARTVCCSPSGDVFVARHDNWELLRIDGSSGVVTARVTLPSDVRALHALGDKLVVVMDSAIALIDESLETQWTRAEPTRSVASSSDRLCVDRLFVLTRDTMLICVDARDGTVVWSRRVGHRTLAQLVAEDGRVAFAVESVLVGLSDAGSVQWVYSAPRRIVAGPVACGRGAVAVIDHSGIVRLLGTKDGEHIASYLAMPNPIALAGSPNMLVGLSADGDVWGIDMKSGVAVSG